MLLRVALVALMALGLTGFGTVSWIATRPPTQPSAAAPAMVKLVTSARPLHAGSLLKPEDLATAEIPAASARAEAFHDTPETRSSLLGAMVRRSLIAGEPISTDAVLRPGDHGFLAAVLAPGSRLSADLVLEGELTALWFDQRRDLVRVAIAILLLAPKAAQRRILLQRSFTAEVKPVSAGAAAIVAATRQALANVFSAIESALAAAVSGK